MVISSVTQNIPALDVIRQMHLTENNLGTNIQRLSTGLRINSSADNPGDMVTYHKLRSRMRSVDQANLNTQNVASMAATASSALSDIIDRLDSIRTQALAAANTGVSETVTRAGYQAEIQQLIDEMDQIVSATTFNGKRLLDGSHGSTTQFAEPNRFPGSIAFGADASTLRPGTSILSVVQSNAGSARISTGDTGGMSLGIANRTDIAVSVGQFVDESAPDFAAAGDSLRNLNFAQVSLHNNGTIRFSGVIADGATSFSGEVSITGPLDDINALVTALQTAIDAAEASVGVDGAGNGPYETVVSYDNTTGRLEFTNGQGNVYSDFSVSFTVEDDTGTTQTISGDTRAPNIFNAEVTLTTISGAELGNSLTSITGSTFDTGTFEITVSDATAAQQRIISTTYAFTNGGGAPVTSATNINNTALFNGTTTLSLSTGDTIDFTGTDPDGTTFNGAITIVAADTGVGQGDATTYGDLINELNHRDQTSAFYGWNNATATLSSGKIRLEDDIAASSSTAMQMVVNASGTAVDDGVVVYSGNAEQATISIAGGEAQTVEAGAITTFQGVESTVPGRTYQVTFRVGENLFDGSDALVTTAQEYIASLNSGASITFRNGDQGVFLSDGNNPTGNIAGAQQIKLNFDTVLGITADQSSGGEKFMLETTADRLNYHIGPDAQDDRLFAFFDVRSTNLGTSSSQRLADINVSTLTGAENAIDVIDASIDQVNLVDSVVGSLGSRMQNASDSLDTYSLNLDNAVTTLASADIAKETTELAMNYVLMSSQTAVLVQSTLIPKSIVPLLFGIKLD